MFASEIFLAALTQSLVGVSMGARGRGGGGGQRGAASLRAAHLADYAS